MSFVRVRKTYPSSGIPRKKRITKKKPAWDDTIQDLTRLKATPEEIEQRKVMHKSKNGLALKLEKQHKEKQGQRDLSLSAAEARQLAIMKEVLYDQQQFHDVISKSDKMMSVVKDLFGDDPKRFTGFPTVTSAPNADDPKRAYSIVAPVPNIQTRMETLSDSMMDKSALNDLSQTESDEEEDELEPILYQPKMNMERFQQFLESEEKNQTLSTISGQAHMSHLDQGPIQSTRIQETQSLQTTQENALETPRKNPDESVSILRTPRSAINDTKKIKRTKKRVKPEETTLQNTTTTNLADLRKVLESLENEIAEFERQTGRRAPAEQPRQETFSGYTMSLVDSVTKLSKYLKENELRLRAETTVREQLTQDVSQLKALVDALTSDIIHTQEEYGKLESEFVKHKQQTQKEMAVLKDVLKNAGLLPPEMQSSEDKSTLHSKASLVQPQFYQMPQYNSGVPNSIPDHMAPASAAVLLSPPVRKTRVQRDQESEDYQAQLGSVKAVLPFSDPHVSEQSQQGSNIQMPETLQNGYPQAMVTGNVDMSYKDQNNVHRGQYQTDHNVHVPTSSVPSHNDYRIPLTQQLPPSSVQSHNEYRIPLTQQLPPSSVQSQNDYRIPLTQQLPPSSVQSHNDYRIPLTQEQYVVSQDSSTFQSSTSTSSMPNSAHIYHHPDYNTGQPQSRQSEGQTSQPLPTFGASRPQNTVTRVSVPRPSPLVQSNVGIPINRSNFQVPDHGLHTQKGSDKVVMTTQIAELNKQHEEAQKRLQSLMQQQLELQQEQQVSQHSVPTSQQAHHTQQVRGPATSDQVSPPISPISERSDNFMSLQGMTNKNLVFNPSARGITVAIPMADLSLESSPSPK